MRAKALICHADQTFRYADVILPDPGPRHVLVRTRYTGVSIGTEFALIRGKVSWGPYPLCTGYQGVGVVETVGEQVEGFKPGDRVYFRDNKHISLPDGRAVSAVTGGHCSMIVVDVDDTHGIGILPDGVEEATASFYVMPAVGLNGVDMANPRMGQRVLVYGVGLIGLGVVAACAHRGCVVVAADVDEKRLAVARRLGADHVIHVSEKGAEAEVRNVAPEGADVVFECTGIPECINTALSFCRLRGTFVWQGDYGSKPVLFHFLRAHAQQLTTFFPCDDGLEPCRRAVLRNMARGALPWNETITHRIDAVEAPDLYHAINVGEAKDALGVVICWP